MFPFPMYQLCIYSKNYATDSSSPEDDFIEIERCDVEGTDPDSDDVSDPDSAEYWYADSFDVDVLNQSGRDMYIIPEMEERNNPLPTNSTVSCKNESGEIEEGANLDTPTTACTDRSAGENTSNFRECIPFINYLRNVILLISLLFLWPSKTQFMVSKLLETSLSSDDDNFIGVIAIDSHEYTTSARQRRKVVTFQDVVSAEVMVSSTPQDNDTALSPNWLVAYNDDADDDDVSDPDEANYWYSASSTSVGGNRSDLDTDDIPDMSGSKNASSQTTIVTRNDTNSVTKDLAEIKFHQLMVLMMLRHFFGSFLPGVFDPWQNLFKTQLLHAQHGGGSGGKKGRKGIRTMIKRELQVTDKTFEVNPQLQREDDIDD